MRARMSGGVGGGPGDPALLPDLVDHFKIICHRNDIKNSATSSGSQRHWTDRGGREIRGRRLA
jgi:hypothetical protein